jgi:hypothetical protein
MYGVAKATPHFEALDEALDQALRAASMGSRATPFFEFMSRAQRPLTVYIGA